MKLSQFNVDLTKDKIATELMPEVDGRIQWRDECKLMVLHKDSGEIEHRKFKDLIDYFGKGDRIVLNDTKVFPAKLWSCSANSTGSRSSGMSSSIPQGRSGLATSSTSAKMRAW